MPGPFRKLTYRYWLPICQCEITKFLPHCNNSYLCLRNPVRLRLRCQREKRCRSASGCGALRLHNPHLPPFAKAALPAAGRLPAGAGHRAAVVDVDDSADRYSDGNQSQCQHGCCLISIGVHTIYEYLRQRRVRVICIGYSAIGDFETFYYSRLTAKFSVSGVRRSVQGLRCPQSLRPETSVQCEGIKSVSCGRFVGLRPPKPPCWGYLAPLCRHSRQRRATGC